MCQNVELKNLNATKDKFFSIVGHDIKQPLNSVIGLVDLLSHEQIEDEAGFMPWSLRAVRYEAMNAVRKHQREIRLSDEALNQLDRQWLKADRAQSSELIDALDNCLKKLTPRAQKLIRGQKGVKDLR